MNSIEMLEGLICMDVSSIDSNDKYHIDKMKKIKERKIESSMNRHGDKKGIELAFEKGFFNEDQDEVIEKLYNKYFSKEGIKYILNREGDPSLDFLKKTIFKKVSFITIDEYNSLFEEHEKNDTLDELANYLEEVRNRPIEGQIEFTLEEVANDDNICYNDDGEINTTSNYMYEFEDISEHGCVGTWGVISDIIRCVRNSKDIDEQDKV